jgi:hypothetical protein
MADSLGAAILNQDDPETVRDGAPAYLLMLDSFVERSPQDAPMLRAASELYAAYGTVFVDDPARARRLTVRSLEYGRRALCADQPSSCTLWDRPYTDFTEGLASISESATASAYTAGLAWLAYIRAHREDWSALAELPSAEALLLRVRELDSQYRPASMAHLLGVLNTLRPPALGGRFDQGRAYFEEAIERSDGLNLAVKVDFARYYARTLYERELHDRLLTEVLETAPRQQGLTLMNTIAQRDARALLDSADAYF